MTPGWSMSRHHHRRHHPHDNNNNNNRKEDDGIKKVPPIEIAKRYNCWCGRSSSARRNTRPRKDYESIASAISRLGPTYVKFVS